MDNSPINLLTVEHDPFKISIVESCGLYFEPQLVEITIPAEESKLFWLTDTVSGRSFPVQPSESKPGTGFLWVEIQPFESIHLEVDPFGDYELPVAPVRREGDSIGNGHIRLGLPAAPTPTLVPGPVKWIQAVEASARLGMTFFDSGPVDTTNLKWLEQGPLRDAYRYEVEFAGGGFYRATVSLDAGQDFARIDEELAGAPGDQLVWDFGPERLPEEIFLLDPTPGGAFRRLHFNFDARHARLCAWTQYQQLHDLSDGFGLIWPEAFVGFVTLDGGSWNGNRLNFLEAWTRRYWHDDRRTRRLEPSDAKSDSTPGPEAIPARGLSQAVPHVCVEGWIGGSPQHPGRRSFALVAAPADRLFPGAQDRRRGSTAEHNHFSHLPERERYAREQCRLRRIHVQRGMLPLQSLLDKCFVWPEEHKASEPRFGYPDPLLEHQFRHHKPDEAGRIGQMQDYLASRVHGFWEGGGASHSNCVVSRVVAPEMLHYEYLAGEDKLAPEERALLRAHFAFLSHLFHSDNYYPGDATMRGPADALSFEPTIAGMANQNFYTDVICVPATAAQVFSNHPDAKVWRDKFTRDWARQLEYHSYPESGVWEESHTYFEHVLHTVAPTLLRRRDDGDEAPGGGFASARFQKVVGSQIPQLAPGHRLSDGLRHLVAFGDHEANRHPHFRLVSGALAQAFAPHNAGLAGQLAWMSEEVGGGEVPGIESIAPEWRDGGLQGLGYFFRDETADGRQTLLALRCGSAWGHHHHDEGSLQFFARGEQLIADSAFGHGQPHDRKFIAPGHSAWGPEAAPRFDVFWRFNRGWITRSRQEGLFPFAAAWTPVYMDGRDMRRPTPLWPYIRHWRTIIKLAPDAFLIVDTSDATVSQVVRFHVPDNAVTVEGLNVAAHGGATQVQLVPLEGVQSVEASRTDAPYSEADAAFSTREICFSTGRAQRSVILLAATDSGGAVRTVNFDAGCRLVGPDWNATVLWVEDSLVLRDEATGAEVTFGSEILQAE